MASTDTMVRIGAAGFALALSLAGPQAAGVAAADRGDTDPSTVSEQSSDRAPATGHRPAARKSRSAAASPAAAGDGGSSAARTGDAIPAAAVTATAEQRRHASLRAVLPSPAISVAEARARSTLPAVASAATAATVATVVAPPGLGPAATVAAPTPAAPQTTLQAPVSACRLCQAAPPRMIAPPPAITAVGVKIDETLDLVAGLLGSLPSNGVTDLLSGALMLVRRTLFNDAPSGKPVQLGQTTSTVVGTIGGVDPEGDRIVYTVLTQPAGGTVTLDQATGVYTYTPAVINPYGSTDQFTVRLCDTGVHLHLFRPAGTEITVPVSLAPAAGVITFPEIDSATSPLAIRVDKSQTAADGIKIDAGSTVTLTLPGPVTSYTWLANKPALADISAAGNQLTLSAKTAGFLGLSVKSEDGTAARYLGVYIGDSSSHVVPDMSTVGDKPPVGTVALPNGIGDAFLESSNFRTGVAPIDYLYIYDQGGPDVTDGNVKNLLTQAVRHGLVPVVVFYNIQATQREGSDAAFNAINDADFMQRYYTKMAAGFTLMNQVGVPVQVVMEPDFLSYMQTATPPVAAFVPFPNDRSLNTAKVSPIYAAGLLNKATDPPFEDTLTDMVKAINYYVGKNMPNLRIGWATNIWGVNTDFVNQSMGLMHETDSSLYLWQNQWSGGQGWQQGRTNITNGVTKLASFLDKVGVTYWEGSGDRKPFLTIDKYGVDGGYLYDKQWAQTGSGTAAVTNVVAFIMDAQFYCTNGSAACDDANTQKYFGLKRDDFVNNLNWRDTSSTNFQTAMAALQHAAVDDPNIAQWFFNADQWSSYLLMVKILSTDLNTKVMLWQIPQGHINGSTKITGRDLPNTNASVCATGAICGFEDSATSYFFGDSFTATGGRLTHFAANNAGDAGVTVSGNTVTWDEHMTQAGKSGAMSVLFGAGIGPSTRGAPTSGGDITDAYFWLDKAVGYLSGH